MGKDVLKQQAMKKLGDSHAAQVVSRPGRLPHHAKNEENAFLRRVRRQDSKNPVERFAANRLSHQEAWARIAHLSLLALNRLFEENILPTTPTQVRKNALGKTPGLSEIEQAYGMVHQLLDALSTVTTEALVAQIILDAEGRLRAISKRKQSATTARRAGYDANFYSPSSIYRDQPVTRLEKTTI